MGIWKTIVDAFSSTQTVEFDLAQGISLQDGHLWLYCRIKSDVDEKEFKAILTPKDRAELRRMLDIADAA